MRTRWISLVFLVSLAFAGCVPSEAGPDPSTELPPPDPQEVPSEEPSPTSTENPLQLNNTPESKEMPSNPPPVEKFVSLAKRDLAERLQIQPGEIALIKTAEMTWPNAALGCPSPGKVYAQGQVPGYQLWLQAEGVEYVYNTDLLGQVILCPQYHSDDLDSLIPKTPGPTKQIGVPID